ncbi:MAG: response regulator transcription factor [Kofleriaceae bacterium]
MTAERILVMEDDAPLGAQIVEHLRGAGWEPLWWTEGRAPSAGVLASLQLVILDLMLPGTHGLDVLKAVRAASEVPVLVLSARNATEDKVRALRLGADDYMTKPFWPQELVERVRARLRRPSMASGDVLTLGELCVDVTAAEVRVAGRAVELTRVELALLVALVRRRGHAVTREWLVTNVLDPDREGTARTLDVHVSRLRKKLGDGVAIETVWGIGYRLRDRDER